ncbi:hypothetical protein [Mesorhizobium sp.]|uniref:hypothetical protein n=1 Tax=Mesorhizobium sp. TaxID=1871066 RepID=UPI0025C277C0|nr:hypothetical protein [Mesorhizobium sp.]
MPSENRLVAAELEQRWNRSLIHVSEIVSKIAAYDAATPRPSPVLATDITALATDLWAVWSAPTTDDYTLGAGPQVEIWDNEFAALAARMVVG